MSNLSDIGFPVKGDEEINTMIISVLDGAVETKIEEGFYLRFTDPSGSELYLQGNPSHEMIGFNPHYAGTSRNNVTLLQGIARETSELDGAYHAAAGGVEFIFDVPDFLISRVGSLPTDAELQLTAFGSNDFAVLGDEAGLAALAPAGSWEKNRFVPPGLKELLADPATDIRQMRPVVKMTGTVKDWALKTNEVNGNKFYWILAETEVGEVDVVIDPQYVPNEPAKGDHVAGHFWLSGKIL